MSRINPLLEGGTFGWVILSFTFVNLRRNNSPKKEIDKTQPILT